MGRVGSGEGGSGKNAERNQFQVKCLVCNGGGVELVRGVGFRAAGVLKSTERIQFLGKSFVCSNSWCGGRVVFARHGVPHQLYHGAGGENC